MLEGDFGVAPGFLLLEAFFLNPVTKAPVDDPTELIDPTRALIGEPDKLRKADPALLEAACQKVKAAITFDDVRGTVTMKSDHKWGPLMVTLVGGWASVQDQAWVSAQGKWDGNCRTWQNFYSIPSEVGLLRAKTNGTGPYQLDHWTPNEEIVLTANPNYRDGAAKIERVVIRIMTDFGTRFAALQAGDADWIALGSDGNRGQLDTLVRDDCDPITGQCSPFEASRGMAGMVLRRYRNMPAMSRVDIALNYSVAADSPFIGSGTLDGNGIPPDFFADVNIRRAFAYCLDVETYIKDLLSGEGVPSRAITLPGQPGYDTATRYPYDLDKCKAAFAASTLRGADGKTVNELGFYVQLPNVSGSSGIQTAAQILADSLAKVNPKFVLVPTQMGGPALSKAFHEKSLPIFFVGWQEDIHDPHNWYIPYLTGAYAIAANFPDELKAAYAELINQGVFETNQVKRAAIYQQLNQLVYDNAAYLIGIQALVRHYEPLYLHGWWGSQNQNPLVNGMSIYFYDLYKD